MSKVLRKDVAEVIARMMRESGDRQGLALQIAAYLVQERRTKELDGIMRDVAKLREKSDGVHEITVTTKTPISADIRSEIKALYSGQQLVINESIDRRVLSGIRVESRNELLDLTARSKLDRLKQSFTGQASTRRSS